MYHYPSAYYFLFDASLYVSGEDVDKVREGLHKTFETLTRDPLEVESWDDGNDAKDLPFFFLKYNSEVEALTVKAKAQWEFEIPRYVCQGPSKLGKAFQYVSEHIARTTYRVGWKHDFPPTVFVFTAGRPTDDVYDGLMALKKQRVNVYIALVSEKYASLPACLKEHACVRSLSSALFDVETKDAYNDSFTTCSEDFMQKEWETWESKATKIDVGACLPVYLVLDDGFNADDKTRELLWAGARNFHASLCRNRATKDCVQLSLITYNQGVVQQWFAPAPVCDVRLPQCTNGLRSGRMHRESYLLSSFVEKRIQEEVVAPNTEKACKWFPLVLSVSAGERIGHINNGTMVHCVFGGDETSEARSDEICVFTEQPGTEESVEKLFHWLNSVVESCVLEGCTQEARRKWGSALPQGWQVQQKTPAEPELEIEPELGAVTLRAPVYLLVDTSESMQGQVDAVKKVVEQLWKVMGAERASGFCPCVSIVAFNSSARLVLPLTYEDDFVFPDLGEATGSAALGKALEFLSLLVEARCGDREPRVVVISKGYSTDDFTAGCEALNRCSLSRLAACGVRGESDYNALHRISDYVLNLDSVDESDMRFLLNISE